MTTSRKRILITGIAGFIGYHLAIYLKKRGDFVVGLDNFNSYYDPELKRKRALELQKQQIEICTGDICQDELLYQLFLTHQISHCVHLAAQAGVRHSLQVPQAYVTSNLQGFVNVLEACRKIPHLKLIFASSSSVYGLNKKIPFSEKDPTDLAANLYGATKKANEVMAHSYHHVYGLCSTALRYFTVYGPWGRPDMAYYRFTKQICESKPIQIFHQGLMQRDFTYIDDIVKGTAAAIDLGASFEIFNLGNHQPASVLQLIELLEEKLGKKAIRQMLPMPQGEVMTTYANIEKSQQLLGFQPKVALDEGLSHFIDWYIAQNNASF